MARSPSPSSHSRPPHAREMRGRSPRTRPARVYSPRARSAERRKSPHHRSSPRRRSPDRRRSSHHHARLLSGNRIGGNPGGVSRGRGGKPMGSSAAGQQGQRRKNKRNKWRKNRNRKRRRGGVNQSGPPVSGGNRQPISSMRMRMDDYVPPRTGRLLPLGKGADIEHAVARARREASTRTKDTFWTKKLLDAEASHPNRWVHSGFKELYREELGYSDQQESEEDKTERGSRSERKPLQRKGSPNRPRDQRQRSRSRSPKRSPKKMQKRSSRSKSPRQKTSKSPLNRTKKLPHTTTSHSNRGKDASYSRSNKRPYSPSLSSSSSSFSSYSGSYSKSYSSYSRSSSSSSTSSFTSSSSASSLSFHRRSFSKSSRSSSGSVSPRRLPAPPPPPKIKAASLSKAVQSVHVNRVVHQETKKKIVTKTVSNTVKVKNSTSLPSKRVKPKLKEDAIHKKRRDVDLSLANDAYYQKEIAKEPRYMHPNEHLRPSSDMMQGDLRYYKNEPHQNYHRTVIARKKPAHSDVEESDSDSSSDDDGPRKLTLSERFGKLAQLSSQRQEYEGVRMKIVREGGQDKKVYLEGSTRSISPPVGRMSHNAHEKWLREHKTEYDEYQQRYGEFRQWDPHRDLPRELPLNWDDVNVRYRYYKESGYFGDRAITMEDYLKWEEWWYRYRDWLEKYGGIQDMEEWKSGGPYSYDAHRNATSGHWPSRRSSPREKDDRKRRRYQ